MLPPSLLRCIIYRLPKEPARCVNDGIPQSVRDNQTLLIRFCQNGLDILFSSALDFLPNPVQ